MIGVRETSTYCTDKPQTRNSQCVKCFASSVAQKLGTPNKDRLCTSSRNTCRTRSSALDPQWTCPGSLTSPLNWRTGPPNSVAKLSFSLVVLCFSEERARADSRKRCNTFWILGSEGGSHKTVLVHLQFSPHRLRATAKIYILADLNAAPLLMTAMFDETSVGCPLVSRHSRWWNVFIVIKWWLFLLITLWPSNGIISTCLLQTRGSWNTIM